MGRLGLGYSETLLLRPEEFDEIARRWNEAHELRQRDEWERVRQMTVMLLSPHTTKRLEPRRIFPLPWDGDGDGGREGEVRAEPGCVERSTVERFEKMIGRGRG